MNIIILILFFLFSLVHLYHSWLDDARHRAMTKPFPLFLLALYYVCTTTELSWILLLALLTSWLGDVLLIPKGHKWFITGGISFLMSHFLFIGVYIPYVKWDAVPWLLIAILAVVYVSISVAIMAAVYPSTPRKMVIPMGMYMIANSTMNLFALMRLFSLGSAGSIVSYVGAVLFFISDCVLFLVRFHRNPHIIFKRHFTVMLAYLSGELLITLGMLMR